MGTVITVRKELVSAWMRSKKEGREAEEEDGRRCQNGSFGDVSIGGI